MASYYLVPYIGEGTDRNPFRPDGADQDGWRAIDLRPDSTVLDGRALLRVPDRADTVAREYLGDALDDRTGAVKQTLESRLGVTLTATAFREQIAELLIEHGGPGRWAPLRPTVAGRYEIVLGERIYTAPLLRGGATITESWDKADSTVLGPDLTWTEVLNNSVVASQKWQTGGSAGSAYEARAEHDLATDNHYAQGIVNVVNSTVATDNFIGLLIRHSAAARTAYQFQNRSGSGGATEKIRKIVATTITELLSEVGDVTMTDVLMRFEANGSTLTGYKAGVPVMTLTDTAITGFVRCGVYGQLGNAAVAFPNLDNFEAGDLVAPGAEPAFAGRRVVYRLAPVRWG
jgi:uncharacterized protein YodC (DUF2158 family)